MQSDEILRCATNHPAEGINLWDAAVEYFMLNVRLAAVQLQRVARYGPSKSGGWRPRWTSGQSSYLHGATFKLTHGSFHFLSRLRGCRPLPRLTNYPLVSPKNTLVRIEARNLADPFQISNATMDDVEACRDSSVFSRALASVASALVSFGARARSLQRHHGQNTISAIKHLQMD